MIFKAIYKSIVHAFYPSRCPYCGYVTFKDTECCEDCRKNLKYDVVVTPLYKSMNVSPFKYSGINKRAVLSFKFYKNPDFAEQFAVSIKKAMTTEYQYVGAEKPFDIITCVPITKKRYYERGYNQSALIAKYLGDLLGVKFEPVLIKIKDTKPQHTLPKDLRKSNVKGVFDVDPKFSVSNKSVLLIDDILTTGSTLNECIDVLYKNGAKQVLCATYATATKDEIFPENYL